MSYYSEIMQLPRSNLTLIADKLIKKGLVERHDDSSDRRVVILKITPQGESYLQEIKLLIRNEFAKKMSTVSDEDISRFNQLIEEMEIIIRKIYDADQGEV